jgi:uncharacterized protein (TIRG00374 family)
MLTLDPSIAAESTGGFSRRKAVTFSIIFLLAAVLLFYSLRGIEWRQVGRLMAGAKPGYLALTAGIGAVTLFLRSFRWRILLNAEGHVGISNAFWATSAGYFGNNFLPARAGELVRTFMISSRAGLNKAYVLATALSERVADAIALVVISSLVLLTLPAQPGWLATAAKPFAILGLAGVLAIALLPRLERLGRKILERVPMPSGLREKLLGVMGHGLRGIRAFHDPKRLLGFLGLTLVIWCLDAVGTMIGAAALGLAISLPVAFLLIAGLGLGSALPSTPGYVGIYQFVAVSVLVPFGFSKTDAIAYILMAQALQYVVIGVFGAGGLLAYRRMKGLKKISSRVSLGDRLDAWAKKLDSRPALILLILAVVYVALIRHSVYRHLWYDELHTFYIAQAPSIPQLLREISLLDLNPPLSYLLVRASLAMGLNPELGARLPMILGFFLGSVGLFRFVARRAGSLWAAAAVFLFWSEPILYYAAESRPYGVLLGSLGLMLLCWDPATGGGRRLWALAGIAAGNAGMILSHVYAPLWVLPFCAAELWRAWRTRKVDWPLGCVLVLPVALVVTYIPLFRNTAGSVPPPWMQGSASKAVGFFANIFLLILIPLIGATVVAFAIALWRRGTSTAVTEFRGGDLMLLLTALLPPVLINAVSMQRHIPFSGRYALPTILMAYALVILFIAYECRTNRLSGLAAATIVFGFTLLPALCRSVVPETPKTSEFEHIRPDLPFVTNSALTFLEMDRYEDPALVARLYYLVDRDSALRYDQSNLTEGLPTLKKYFPIRATVSPYTDFVAKHRTFLVWGVMDQSGWLLRKLKTEGARIIEAGKFDTVYADSQLYEINLDP